MSNSVMPIKTFFVSPKIENTLRDLVGVDSPKLDESVEFGYIHVYDINHLSWNGYNDWEAVGRIMNWDIPDMDNRSYIDDDQLNEEMNRLNEEEIRNQTLTTPVTVDLDHIGCELGEADGDGIEIDELARQEAAFIAMNARLLS